MPQHVRTRPGARSAPRRRPPLRWHSPASELWIATAAGEYAGMAEPVRAGGYRAFGPTGGSLGSFPTLGDALMALEGRVEDDERTGQPLRSSAAPAADA